MKVNLSKLVQQRTVLQTVVSGSAVVAPGGMKKIKELLRFIEEIETDLELGGESIVELDKERLEALEERNKMLKFMREADDV